MNLHGLSIKTHQGEHRGEMRAGKVLRGHRLERMVTLQ